MHLKVKIGCTRSDYSSCTPQSCFGHDHGDLSHPRLERRYTPRLPQLPPASRSGAGRTASRTFLDLAIFEGDAPPRFAHPPYPRRIGTGQPSAIRFYPRSGRRRQRGGHCRTYWPARVPLMGERTGGGVGSAWNGDLAWRWGGGQGRRVEKTIAIWIMTGILFFPFLFPGGWTVRVNCWVEGWGEQMNLDQLIDVCEGLRCNFPVKFSLL
jgi:hypothetical protein